MVTYISWILKLIKIILVFTIKINTGQYTSFYCQLPKLHEPKHYFFGANKIYRGKQNFKQQIDHIKTLMSWKTYLETVHNSIINRLKSKVDKNITSTIIKTFEKLF